MSDFRLTNEKRIPLALAVFLATDNYDYDPNTVSATRLLKPPRQLVLASRVPSEKRVVDIDQRIQSALGSAIHDSIERAWITDFTKPMSLMGYLKRTINRIKVNPDPATLKKGDKPIYLEQRHYRDITVKGKKFKISGKMDFIAEGAVQDFKTTIAYTFKNSTKVEDFKLQGSIYRWLAPHLITADHIHIHYIFMDWAAYKVNSEKNYPPSRCHSVKIPLLPIEETEQYIRQKLSAVIDQQSLPEEEITYCTDKELWRDDPVFKFYAKAENAGVPGKRSTKNFDSMEEALTYQRDKKGVGTIVTVPGQVKACRFCAAAPICTQKDQYLRDGILHLD